MPGVDVETLAVNRLLADPGVAALVADRVFDEYKAGLRFPLLLAFRVGGPVDFLNHLDPAVLQVESWAKSKAEALALAQEALAALLAATGSFDEGVIAGASVIAGLAWLPIVARESRTARYVFRIQIRAHPIPVSA